MLTLPDEIPIDPKSPLSADEWRAVVRDSGQSWDDLTTPDARGLHVANAIQIWVWVALHRAGYRATWEQAGTVHATLE